MTMRKCASFAEIVFVALLAAGSSGCSGGSASTPPPSQPAASVSPAISVSLSGATATVEEGATAQFAAMVANDAANKGVSWTVSCSTAACGSVSPSSTASGAPTTYTPPGSPASNLTVTLTAASVTDATKSASLTVTVPALAISLEPISTTVQAGATAQFTATVTNDGANKGVIWTVSCSAAPCGSVSPLLTASGVATTYTAPAAPPASGLTVMLTATSVTDGAKIASETVTIPASTQAITVSVTPNTARVQVGGTAQFTATVTNDSANKGVTWAVSCSAAPCGTVSPTTTASGSTTTYTAPATSPASGLTVTVMATSVTDGTKTASATVTIPPAIAVSVAPSTETVQVGGSASFTATVTNDSANKGVTWAVSCSAAPCGSVSPTATASGKAVTYIAPSNPPASNLKVTLTATSVSDTTKAASATITVPSVSVTVTPSSASVPAGGTAQFTTTVGNDPSNGGVTWSLVEGFQQCQLFFPLRCGPTSYSSCAPTCGTVSPITTVSGVPTTYTAPPHFAPPAPRPCSFQNPYCTRFTGLFLQATSVTNSAAFGHASITILNISLSVSPSTATVAFTGKQQFTATVTNDATNSGVTWKLLQNGVACSPSCGTVSPVYTASAVATTYTGPASALVSPSVTITAISVEDLVSSGSATITVPVISISINPPSASVPVGTAPQFTATVLNDVANSGVTWKLTQNGVACSPTCGTLSLASGAVGAPAIYTAPSVVPPVPVVTLTASSVADTTKLASAAVTVTTASGAACGAGSGSESLLKGQYAFLLLGNDSSSVVVLEGSFAADGTGKITGGEEDSNGSATMQTDATIDPTASFYAVGSDHRGCLALAVSGGGTTYFRFALGSLNSSNIATAGHIIQFDDTTGTGRRLAGTIRLQDPTSFVASQFKGNYVVGLMGVGSGNRRLTIAGTFAADGASALPIGTFDLNDGGTIASDLVSTSGGSFTCCSANGRGTLTLPLNANGFSLSDAFYMISSSDAFLVNSGFGQYGGEAIGVASGITFDQTSLNGASVLRETAHSGSGPIVDVATAKADGKGAMTVNDNINNAGTFATGSSVLNYVVASNGRVVTTGLTTPPVVYLYAPNRGFLVGTDADVTFGTIEPQSAGPFSDASLSGAYTIGTENPSASTVTTESGVASADGKGNAAGSSDQSSAAGLTQNQPVNLTYSIAADGTGTFGGNTTAILVSGNKLVFINNTSSNPTITVVEK